MMPTYPQLLSPTYEPHVYSASWQKQYVAQFFTLESGEKNGNSATYRCRLHPEAPVFKAHFPGFPVLPGVLTLKMVVDAINASQFSPRRR